jgi:hypothetical protein
MCIPVEPNIEVPLHIEHFAFFLSVWRNTELTSWSADFCAWSIDTSGAEVNTESDLAAFAAAAFASGCSCLA